MSATKTQAPTLDPASADVQYGAGLSTRYTSVFYVPSRSQSYARMVTHSPRDERPWRCSCPARPGTCHHIRTAKAFDRTRWWGRLVDGMTHDDRDDFLLVLDARLMAGEATDDDRVAYAVLCQRFAEVEAAS